MLALFLPDRRGVVALNIVENVSVIVTDVFLSVMHKSVSQYLRLTPLLLLIRHLGQYCGVRPVFHHLLQSFFLPAV